MFPKRSQLTFSLALNVFLASALCLCLGAPLPAEPTAETVPGGVLGRVAAEANKLLEDTRAHWEPLVAQLPPQLAAFNWAASLVSKEDLAAAWNREDNKMVEAHGQWLTEWRAPKTVNPSADVLDFSVDEVRGDPAYPSWMRLLADWLYPVSGVSQFRGSTWSQFCRMHETLPWVTVTVYIIFVFLFGGGLKLKEGEKFPKPSFALKWFTALWNFSIFVFSLCGALRTLPHLALGIHKFGLVYTVCRNSQSQYGEDSVGFWVCLFIFSKYVELGDTVLLVLRGKKVQFLHWYHHATVLLYCWDAYMWENPTGLHFVAMNYSVHTVMYLFYAIAAVGKPPSWALGVTLMQLSQMVVGMAMVLVHLSMLNVEGLHCGGSFANLLFAFAIYASYFYLFFEFMLKRYCGCGKRKQRSSGGGKANSTGKAHTVNGSANHSNGNGIADNKIASNGRANGKSSNGSSK